MKEIFETERSAKGTVSLATVVESSCQHRMRHVKQHPERCCETKSP